MPEVSDVMGPLEWERWERFCRTGRVSDYLNYRAAMDRLDGSEDEGESVDADVSESGGALGQEYGGI